MQQVVLWKLFIVLFLGARPVGPAAPAPPIRQCFAREVPIYAEADVSAIRRMLAETPELREIVLEGQDPAVAYEDGGSLLSSLGAGMAAGAFSSSECCRGERALSRPRRTRARPGDQRELRMASPDLADLDLRSPDLRKAANQRLNPARFGRH